MNVILLYLIIIAGLIYLLYLIPKIFKNVDEEMFPKTQKKRRLP